MKRCARILVKFEKSELGKLHIPSRCRDNSGAGGKHQFSAADPERRRLAGRILRSKVHFHISHTKSEYNADLPGHNHTVRLDEKQQLK